MKNLTVSAGQYAAACSLHPETEIAFQQPGGLVVSTRNRSSRKALVSADITASEGVEVFSITPRDSDTIGSTPRNRHT
jgi:hypothetical protein